MQDLGNLKSRQYLQGWNNPYFVIPVWLGWWLTGFSGGSVSLYLLMGGKVSWIFNVTPLASIVLLVIFYGACLTMLIQGIGFCTDSYLVRFDEDQLIGIKIFGLPKYQREGFDYRKLSNRWCKVIPYEKIQTIRPIKFSGSLIGVHVESFQHGKAVTRISIPGGNSHFGTLSERLLPLCSNIENFDVTNYPSRPVSWGKSPDWTIINAAKRRAEENRKKLKQFSAETQGTKESA